MISPTLALSVCLIAAHPVCHSQQSVPPETPSVAAGQTGTVVGLLLDEQTRLPIRFAHIVLMPVPGDAAPEATVQPATGQPIARFQRAEAESGMDGHWRAENVPPGDYLIAAFHPGYVTPGSSFDFLQSDAQKKAMIASMPSVHVAAGDTASVTMTLSKGGVISGRIVFADGSPAIGITVGAEPADQLANSQALQNSPNGSRPASPRDEALSTFKYGQRQQPTITDDQGRYRISGLPNGKYLIGINLIYSDRPSRSVFDNSTTQDNHIPMSPEPIPVFAPGVVLHAEAKQFELSGREEIPGADMTIDVHALHTIQGTAVRSGDLHPMANCMVRLHVDDSNDFGRFTTCAEDGTFALHYLPAGHYTVALFSSDIDSKPLQFYEADQIKVIIVDRDISLEAIPLKALKPGAMPDIKLF
jgi:hypothetical protein